MLASDKKEPLLPAECSAYGGDGRSTVCQSTVTLLKAVVGSGVFALPAAMRLCGWALGAVFILLMAVISLYTATCMVASVREMRRRGFGADSGGRIEYQEVTRFAFPQYDGIITLLCVLGQFGSVTSFFTFVISTIVPVTGLQQWQVCLVVLAIVGPLALLRNTSHPAFSAAMTFGNFAVAAALLTIATAAADKVHHRIRPHSV